MNYDKEFVKDFSDMPTFSSHFQSCVIDFCEHSEQKVCPLVLSIKTWNMFLRKEDFQS